MDVLNRSKAAFTRNFGQKVDKLNQLIAEPQVDVVAVTSQISYLHKKWPEIEACYTKIIDLLVQQDDEDPLQREVDELETWRMKYISSTATGENLIKPPEPSSRPRSVLQNPASHSYSRLPRLDLPKFDGDICSWKAFADSFEALINNRQDLSNVEKFRYLEASLQGEAARCIKGLQATDANYSIACGLLKETYDRHDDAVEDLYTKLSHIPPMQDDSAESLHNFILEVQANVNTLKALGISSNTYGAFLKNELIEKLPPSVLLEWNRCTRGKSAKEKDLDALLAFLRNEMKLRSCITKASTGEGRAELLVGGERFLSSAAALPAITTARQTYPCVFCRSSSHQSIACPFDVTKRKAALAQQWRCFKCLKKQHTARNCPDQHRVCRKCNNAGHHITLCTRGNGTGYRRTNTYAAGQTPANNIVQTPATNTIQTPANNIVQPPANNTVQTAANARTPPATTQMPIENSIQASIQATTSNKVILLQTAQSMATGTKSTKRVRILLDGGSQRSFILENTAAELGAVTVGRETLRIQSFGGESKKKCTRRVRIALTGISGEIEHLEFLETDKICANVPQLPDGEWKSHIIQSGFQLADSGEDTDRIDILIGADQYWTVVYEKIHRAKGGLVAVDSFFGWLLHGAVSVRDVLGPANVFLLTTEMIDPDIPGERSLRNDLKRLYEDKEGLAKIEEDANVQLKDFEDTVQRDGNRYLVELPWCNDKTELPDNFSLAKERLQWQVRRMRKSDLLVQYHNQLQEMVREGFLEEIPETNRSYDGELFSETINDADIGDAKSYNGFHYIPHHAVVRPEKETTKVRMVLDAAAKRKNGHSINDFLHTGPHLNPQLVEVVLRSRKYKIAFSADISKAFLRVGLKPQERDYVRIIWIDDPFVDNPRIVHFRFTRVPFGLKPSLFLLRATILHHIKNYEKRYEKAVNIIRHNLFVDDLLAGADTVDEAKKLWEHIKLIMDEAGMPMVKWSSNSTQLNEFFKAKNSAKECGSRCTLMSKILGLQWDMVNDIYNFDVKPLIDYVKQKKVITKRLVLAVAARVYDPLGILSPSMLVSKLMLRKLCEYNVEWDDEIPRSIRHEFDRWIKDLEIVDGISVNRWYGTSEKSVMNVDIFCDASNVAYGAVAYLNSEDNVTFLMSKSRIAPIQKSTTPRLELAGCLLAAELSSFLKKTFAPEKITVRIASDSEVALAWVIGKSSSDPYVKTRVSKISELTLENEWSFCPGVLNPADIVSRGLSMEKLLTSCWLRGVDYKQSQIFSKVKTADCQKSNASDEVMVQHVKCQTGEDGTDEDNEVLIDFKRISKWLILVRTIALVFRAKEEFKRKLKYKRMRANSNSDAVNNETVAEVNNQNMSNEVSATAVDTNEDSAMSENGESAPSISRKCEELTCSELHVAKIWIFKCIQNMAFPKDVKKLQKGETLSLNSKIRLLQPYLDSDGVLRMKRRTIFSNIEQQSDPIILPAEHHAVNMIIRRVHEEIMHAGVRQTLTELRDEYWIVRGRRAVKLVVSRCVVCRKNKAKPYQQPMAPLPEDRCSEAQAFDTIGVDYAGPVMVKMGHSVVKSYICLITCAASRAIHLEPTYDLSTHSFLLAFDKFISRRGLPRKVYSDNAKTFKAAEKELMATLPNRGIEWSFIAELAPWWGGFWERLVKIVKLHLKKALGASLVTWIEFETVLCRVEAIVNSRPLTYVYNEADEPEPLTPNHLLIGRRSTLRPISSGVPSTSSSVTLLRKRLANKEKIVEDFWKNWSREYLQEIARPNCTTRIASEIKKGAVVLVGDNNKLKQNWEMGIIEDILPGRDGIVRAVIVKTATGRYRRAVQLLCPLEAELTEPEFARNRREEKVNADDDQPQTRPSEIDNHSSIVFDCNMSSVNDSIVNAVGRECNNIYVTRAGRLSKPPARLTYR